jgi:hypothetical protein
MSERSQLAVVLIVALFIGAFVDRVTALKMVAGMVLLSLLQNQTAVLENTRKLLSYLREKPRVQEYRGDLRKSRRAA